MTDITHILSQERTRNDVAARSRKRVLEKASDLLCEGNEQLSGRTLFDELLGGLDAVHFRVCQRTPLQIV